MGSPAPAGSRTGRIPDAAQALAQRWWPLGAVALAVVVLAASDVIPRWPGLVGHVALPPLDLFADVRLVAVEAPDAGTFVAGVAVACAARVAVLTLMLGATGPHLRFAVAFYGAALPVALFATALDLAGRAALYAPLVWAALAVSLGTFGVLAALPWAGDGGLREAVGVVVRRGPPLGTLLGYLVVLGALAALFSRPGELVQVLVVPLAAGLTAIAATRLGRPPRVRPRTRWAALAVLVAVALAGAGWLLAARPDHPADLRSRAARSGSLFLVPGVDTASGSGALFRLPPEALGSTCAQTTYYSYAGTGAGAPHRQARCPIRTGAPYRRVDTTRPLHRLAATFRRQVGALDPPVTVVTHSQGAWVAWAGLAGMRDPGVTDLVMLGAFPETLTTYPPPRETGAGVMTGTAVRAFTGLGRRVGFSHFDPDRPLPRALQGTAGAIEAVFAKPLPRGVRVLALGSRFDLPLASGDFPHDVAVACPGWAPHGGLPTSAPVLAAATRFSVGQPVARCPDWLRRVAHAIAAFGPPPARR